MWITFEYLHNKELKHTMDYNSVSTPERPFRPSKSTSSIVLSMPNSTPPRTELPKKTSSITYLGRTIIAGSCVAGAAYYFYPEKVIASITYVRNAWNTSHTVQVIGQHIHYAIAKLGEINLAAISTPHLLIAAAAIVVIAAAIIYIRRRNASNANNNNNYNNHPFPQTPCTIKRKKDLYAGHGQRTQESPLRLENAHLLQQPRTPAPTPTPDPITLEQWIEHAGNLEEMCANAFEEFEQNTSLPQNERFVNLDILNRVWNSAVEEGKEELILSKLSDTLKAEFYYYVVYQYDKQTLFTDIVSLNPEVIPKIARKRPEDIGEYVISYDLFIRNNLTAEHFGYDSEEIFLKEVCKDKKFIDQKLKQNRGLFESRQKAYAEALFESLNALPDNMNMLYKLYNATVEKRNAKLLLENNCACQIKFSNNEIIKIFVQLRDKYKLTNFYKINEIMKNDSDYKSICAAKPGNKDSIDYFSDALTKNLTKKDAMDVVRQELVSDFLLWCGEELNNSGLTIGEYFLNAFSQSEKVLVDSFYKDIEKFKKYKEEITQYETEIEEHRTDLNRIKFSLWNYEDILRGARNLSEEIEDNGTMKKKGEVLNQKIQNWFETNSSKLAIIDTKWKDFFYKNNLYRSNSHIAYL